MNGKDIKLFQIHNLLMQNISFVVGGRTLFKQ